MLMRLFAYLLDGAARVRRAVESGHVWLVDATGRLSAIQSELAHLSRVERTDWQSDKPHSGGSIW
jgi:hypothetical protein